MKKNKATIALNVLYGKKENIHPAHVPKHNWNGKKQVILLRIWNGKYAKLSINGAYKSKSEEWQ